MKTKSINGLKISKSTRNEYSYTICPEKMYVRGPIHVIIIIIIIKPVNVDNHENNTSHHNKPPYEA